MDIAASNFYYLQANGTDFDRKDQQNLKRVAWYCTPEFCVCFWTALCATAILAAIIALALIPVYRRNGTTSNQQQEESASFRLIYSVNSTNVTDLMITDKTELANRLMNRFNLRGITVVRTQLTSSQRINTESQSLQQNTTRCRIAANATNILLEILFTIRYPLGCDSNPCQENFNNDTTQRIAQSNDRMTLPIVSNDGRTYEINMNLCSIVEVGSGTPVTNLPTTVVRTTTTGEITRTTARSTTTTTRTTRTTTRSATTTRTTTRSATTTRTTTRSTTTTTIRTTSTTTSRTTTTTGTTTTTTDIPCPTTCDPQQACVRGVCVNVGSLGMALAWGRPGDGDIVLTTPTGKTIYWGNREPSASTDYGYLDRDDRVGTGPENIFWQTNTTSPPNGTYHVCFQAYAFTPPPSPENPVQAYINIRRPMSPTLTLTTTVTERFRFNNQCTPNSRTYMGSFTNP